MAVHSALQKVQKYSFFSLAGIVLPWTSLSMLYTRHFMASIVCR